MNCDEYLSMLATLPVEELAYGSARDHAARCRECDRVTRVVVERERNMLLAFGDLQSSVPAAHISASALATSRRRTIALYYKIGLGMAMVATIFYMWVMRRAPVPATARVSETFRLQCLSPEQAAEILRPLMTETLSIVIRSNSDLGVIRVEASPEEMVTARSVVDRYDSAAESQCAVRVTVPREP